MSDDLVLGAGVTLLSVGLLLAALTVFSSGAVAQVTGPFTGGTAEPRCTFSSTVGLEGTGTVVKINTVETDVSETSPLGLSFIGPGNTALSLTEAENVRVAHTLAGPVDVEKTDNLGSVGKFGATDSSSFEARNLPEGTYNYFVDLTYNTGEDHYETRGVTVECGGGR